MTHEESSLETPPPGVVLSYPQSNTTVCTVTGEIDTDTASVLQDTLIKAARDDNAHLVIDLSAITFMDSAGLYALFMARHKHNIGGNGYLAVVIDSNSQAIPQLYAIALDVIFNLHNDLNEALRCCISTGG